MPRYANSSGTSGVVAYDTGSDYIIVEFREGKEKFYKYTHASAGQANVEHMKILAHQGAGLNTFINLNVKDKYESKW